MATLVADERQVEILRRELPGIVTRHPELQSLLDQLVDGDDAFDRAADEIDGLLDDLESGEAPADKGQ